MPEFFWNTCFDMKPHKNDIETPNLRREQGRSNDIVKIQNPYEFISK